MMDCCQLRVIIRIEKKKKKTYTYTYTYSRWDKVDP